MLPKEEILSAAIRILNDPMATVELQAHQAFIFTTHVVDLDTLQSLRAAVGAGNINVTAQVDDLVIILNERKN